MDGFSGFLGVVDAGWDLLGDGIDFLFAHPYSLLGSALSLISYIVSTGKRTIRVGKK